MTLHSLAGSFCISDQCSRGKGCMVMCQGKNEAEKKKVENVPS